ncbi:glucosaminidase domain-containing protein [Candidatus Gottesmanbacteria bacterium]|nr:glucosaminidase domain-containing protein [Candidatus Gottesmanbacteria bacterium]
MKRLLLIITWIPVSIFTLIICLIYLQINYTSASQKIAVVPRIQKAFAQNYAQYNEFLDEIPQVLGASETILTSKDARPYLVERFLKKYDSPLIPHAQFLVDTADKYGLDYALMPAMAMQESNLCKKSPEDSHNCWGFGIYGEKVVKFSSYEEGIDRVGRTLKEKYLEESLTNPDLIMSKWTPRSEGSWSYAVNTFMQEIKQGK